MYQINLIKPYLKNFFNKYETLSMEWGHEFGSNEHIGNICDMDWGGTDGNLLS